MTPALTKSQLHDCVTELQWNNVFASLFFKLKQTVKMCLTAFWMLFALQHFTTLATFWVKKGTTRRRDTFTLLYCALKLGYLSFLWLNGESIIHLIYPSFHRNIYILRPLTVTHCWVPAKITKVRKTAI